MNYPTQNLERAVARVCAQLVPTPAKKLTEHSIRMELVNCLLGSQVRSESANIAIGRLKRAGLLSNESWSSTSVDFEERALRALSGRDAARRVPSYRFPALRARQLSALRERLRARALTDYLSCNDPADSIRRQLVHDLPGIGPKQASMFLRNIGLSYDLAILDVHVLRYLDAVGAIPFKSTPIGTLAAYEKAEAAAKSYANSLGHPVGHLDWAIWITMKAASEIS